MSIRRKTMMVLLLAIAALAFAQQETMHWVLMEGFNSSERQFVEHRVQLTQRLIESEIEVFSNRFVDWAQWDDMSKFVQDRNHAFYESNLLPESLAMLRVNAFAVFDLEGRPVFLTGEDFAQRDYTPFPEDLRAVIAPGSKLLKFQDRDTVTSGLLAFPSGVMMVVSRPISGSSDGSPVVGYLVAGRWLDATEQTRIAKLRGMPLELRSIPGGVPLLGFDAPDFRITADDNAVASWAITDLDGNRTVEATLSVPRPLASIAHIASTYCWWTLGVCGVVMVGAVLGLVEIIVLRRLQRLSTEVMRTDADGVSAITTPMLSGHDEVAKLAGVLRSSFERIAREKELRESAFSALLESEARFRSVSDAAPMLVWKTGPDGRGNWFNRRWLDFTGTKLEQVVDAPVTDFVHPEDVAMFRTRYDEAMSARASFECEFRLRHRESGGYRWVLSRGSPFYGVGGVFEGYIGSAADITEIKLAQSKLEVFVRHAPAAVAMFDREMRYIAHSERWATDYGLGAGSVIGRCHYDVFPEVPETWKHTHRRCLGGAIERATEDLFERANGRRQWLRWEVRPWYGVDGEIGGIIMFTEDVTELRFQKIALANAKEAAESASRAKSEFLANMSHEIRTPMTAVLGYADLLQEPQLDDSQRADHVRTIRRNAEHLLVVINDILDISKIEAGKLELEQAPCNVAGIIEDVRSLMSVKAAEKGLELSVQKEPGCDVWVLSDAIRVRQVILNLVSNAVKFTEKGSVRVVVSHDAQPDGEFFRVEVRDTGIGLSPIQVSKLFRAFTQADTSTTRRFGGTGLGLAISKRLAEMLGGDLQCRSEQGAGSVFAFTFPARICAAPNSAKPSSDEPSTRPLSARILLAEDGVDNQRLISYHLRRAGATVEVVGNGRLAVERALAAAEGTSETRFDLILMDMQMPELDGYGAASEIRRHGVDTPIIALTAHAMSGDRERCIAAGCDDYCTKPINREQFLRVCRQWAGKASTMNLPRAA